jgi:tripartite-type tricarboxylate transporter receptor subunit TctC
MAVSESGLAGWDMFPSTSTPRKTAAMQTKVRFFLALILGVAVPPVCCLAPEDARAQAPYPNHPVKFVVPYAPGGLPDTVARIFGQRLSERLGQPIVVENRSGGNGMVAAATLATAPVDGYTLLVTDGSMLSINPLVFSQAKYDPKKDFEPIALIARSPLFLASHPSLPVASLREFVDYVKAHPGQVYYGSSGIGSTHHLSMEALKSALKLDMTHVPYRGTGQSVPALLGGQVQVLFSAYPSLAGFVDAKKINVLATNGLQRSPQAPDIPAIAELVPGFNFAVIVGILARSGTPKSIIDKVAAEASEVAKMPALATQYDASGIEQASAGPKEFGEEISKEIDRVATVIQVIGIKPE